MLNRVIVFGAQSYIGLGVCKRLVQEGIEVIGIFLSPTKSKQKQLLDEQLMMIGRNALFQQREFEQGYKEGKLSIDMVFHCCDDCLELELILQDRGQLLKSVELARTMKIPYIFSSSSNRGMEGVRLEHIEYCESYLNEHLPERTFVHFPVLFGPFQPHTEKIHRQLIHINKRNESIIIEEPILLIDDAIQGLWELLDDITQGVTYTFKGEMPDLNKTSSSLRIQINIPNLDCDHSDETTVITIPTNVEKGIEAQMAILETYKSIME